ncbi:hypothetical protein [Lacinutrix sp. MEBiC02404]
MPPFDRFTTQTYQESYANPIFDLEVIRIPTEQEVNNAIQVFLNQIDSKKEDFNNKLVTVEGFLNESKVNIEKLDEFIESINDLVIAGNSLLGLIDSYLEYYNTYGRYSTQVSVYHLEIPKIKLELSNALLELEKIKKKLIKSYANKHASRVELDVDNAIDWDESPTIYQATTIAHGHILCFRMRWKADGYSLGEVKYSKSLGPCEKEQVAILDWSRSENSSRLESTISRENFSASFSRDRDVNEVINTSLSEKIKGKSIGATFGTAGGGGAAGAGQYGGFMLGGVGSAFASLGVSGSVASQKATRSLSSSTMNKLRERINQSSQAVRSQRSVVIQSVSQNESVTATTKVIANKNLCHSVNYLFFEILKHYAIEQEIVDVKECLFIPMKITPFDAKKAIRWRHILEQIVPSKDLFLGFDSIQNIENNTPSQNGILADETIQDFFGQLKISFDIPLPNFKDPSDDDIDSWNDTINNEWQQSSWSNWYHPFIRRRFGYGHHRDFYRYEFWKRNEAQKIKNWEDKFVPVIVKDFIEDLQFTAVNGNIRTNLKLDVTQVTKYHKSGSIEVSLNISDDTPTLRRSDIKKIVISSEYSVPNNSNIIVKSGALSYRSQSLNEFIFLNNSIKNDMSNNDTVSLITPLNNRELINPAVKEIERANLLLTFLNDHLSEMHQFIFAGMDRNTRFMMLDGVKLNAASGRSVSSLVENEIVDIVGNSIVMPVASGLRIDPVFRSQDNLLDIYKPKDKIEPFRVSLPTGGYFMEAVQGSCNSCEELDYTKARFHGFGCTDEPTAIQELSTNTRRTDPGDLQAKDLPTNIVNFQNVPQAPNPTDLSSVLSLLGKGDSFRDLSGLTENQKNALAALTKNADSAVAMGQMATDLVKAQMGQHTEKTIDRDLDRINKEKEKGNITDEDAQELSKKALENKNKLNESSSNEKTESKIPEAVESANKSIEKGATKAKVKETRKDGTTTEVEIEKEEKKPQSINRKWTEVHQYLNSGNTVEHATFSAYDAANKIDSLLVKYFVADTTKIDSAGAGDNLYEWLNNIDLKSEFNSGVSLISTGFGANHPFQKDGTNYTLTDSWVSLNCQIDVNSIDELYRQIQEDIESNALEIYNKGLTTGASLDWWIPVSKSLLEINGNIDYRDTVERKVTIKGVRDKVIKVSFTAYGRINYRHKGEVENDSTGNVTNPRFDTSFPYEIEFSKEITLKVN